MAQSGYTREVRACAVFCLSENYPTEPKQFYAQFLKDFTCDRTSTFVGSGTGASRHFVVHGRRSTHLSKPTTPVSAAQIKKANKLRRSLPYDMESAVGDYVQLLETAFTHQAFSVVGRQWKSWMTVYQQPEKGHCYYVAALNMMLHIPGARNHILSRFGVSRGTTDEQLFLDSFIASPLGYEIWRHYSYSATDTLYRRQKLGVDEERYTSIVRQRSRKRLDGTSFALLSDLMQSRGGGGFAHIMVTSFLKVLDLESDIVLVGNINGGRENINETTLHKVGELFNKITHGTSKGCAFLVSGSRDPKKGRTGGHSIVLIYDGGHVTLYNHGRSATQGNALRSFIETYPVHFQCTMYEFQLPHKNLRDSFDSVATPRRRCQRGYRRDRPSGECLPRSDESSGKTTRRRCQNGTRRDQASGLCIPLTLPSTITGRR